MKKHLVLLCGVFYPNPSPTGLCAKRFAETLLDDFDIDVICISENGKRETVTLQNGLCIHTLAGKRMYAEIKSTGFKRKALHTLGAIQIKTKLLGNLSWFRSQAYQELLLIQKRYPIDATFSVCSPFSAHCAAMDFNAIHPEIKWCAYTVDPYATVNRIRPFQYSLKKTIESERKVLLISDVLLLSEEVYKTRSELFYGHDNCKPLPYMLPEFNQIKTEKKYFTTDDINCVYAGSFYNDIRNPERMLQIFSMLSNSGIRLHLFSKGCEDIVKQFTVRNKNIITHTVVTHDTLRQIYHDADILVCLGNSISEFFPSKIYEYIVEQKPIVYFSQVSTANSVFEKYPCSCQISNLMCVEEAADILNSFIVNNHKTIIERDMICKAFNENSSEYIKKILLNALCPL